jgi:hypothetical protein
MSENRVSKPIVPTLNAMGVGDKEAFPAYQMGSVKTLCSDMGFKTDKRFKTQVDRVMKIIYVERIK